MKERERSKKRCIPQAGQATAEIGTQRDRKIAEPGKLMATASCPLSDSLCRKSLCPHMLATLAQVASCVEPACRALISYSVWLQRYIPLPIRKSCSDGRPKHGDCGSVTTIHVTEVHGVTHI